MSSRTTSGRSLRACSRPSLPSRATCISCPRRRSRCASASAESLLSSTSRMRRWPGDEADSGLAEATCALRAAPRRQAHGELAAAAGALARRAHPAAVHLDQGAHQRESDAEPAVRAVGRGLGLDEQLEDLRAAAGARCPLRCREREIDSSSPRSSALEPDPSAGLGELGGVVQQIAQRLREPHQVRVQDDRLVGQHQLERVVPRLDRALADLERVLDHGGEVHVCAARAGSCAG